MRVAEGRSFAGKSTGKRAASGHMGGRWAVAGAGVQHGGRVKSRLPERAGGEPGGNSRSAPGRSGQCIERRARWMAAHEVMRSRALKTSASRRDACRQRTRWRTASPRGVGAALHGRCGLQLGERVPVSGNVCQTIWSTPCTPRASDTSQRTHESSPGWGKLTPRVSNVFMNVDQSRRSRRHCAEDAARWAGPGCRRRRRDGDSPQPGRRPALLEPGAGMREPRASPARRHADPPP